MLRMTKVERKKAIEHNRKIGVNFSNNESINGGVKIDRLPNLDEIVETIETTENWNEFKIR